MDASESESTGLKLRRRKKSRNISDDRFVKGLTGKGMQNVRPLFIYLVILSLMNVNLFFRPRSYESLTHQIVDRGPGMLCRFY